MLLKKPPEYLLPGDLLIEEPLDRSVTAAFFCPSGYPQQGNSDGFRD
jgi:hypothetical protein